MKKMYPFIADYNILGATATTAPYKNYDPSLVKFFEAPPDINVVIKSNSGMSNGASNIAIEYRGVLMWDNISTNSNQFLGLYSGSKTFSSSVGAIPGNLIEPFYNSDLLEANVEDYEYPIKDISDLFVGKDVLTIRGYALSRETASDPPTTVRFYDVSDYTPDDLFIKVNTQLSNGSYSIRYLALSPVFVPDVPPCGNRLNTVNIDRESALRCFGKIGSNSSSRYFCYNTSGYWLRPVFCYPSTDYLLPNVGISYMADRVVGREENMKRNEIFIYDPASQNCVVWKFSGDASMSLDFPYSVSEKLNNDTENVLITPTRFNSTSDTDEFIFRFEKSDYIPYDAGYINNSQGLDYPAIHPDDLPLDAIKTSYIRNPGSSLDFSKELTATPGVEDFYVYSSVDNPRSFKSFCFSKKGVVVYSTHSNYGAYLGNNSTVFYGSDGLFTTDKNAYGDSSVKRKLPATEIPIDKQHTYVLMNGDLYAVHSTDKIKITEVDTGKYMEYEVPGGAHYPENDHVYSDLNTLIVDDEIFITHGPIELKQGATKSIQNLAYTTFADGQMTVSAVEFHKGQMTQVFSKFDYTGENISIRLTGTDDGEMFVQLTNEDNPKLPSDGQDYLYISGLPSYPGQIEDPYGVLYRITDKSSYSFELLVDDDPVPMERLDVILDGRTYSAFNGTVSIINREGKFVDSKGATIYEFPKQPSPPEPPKEEIKVKIEWDKTGERFYETGVDHGVLYVQNGDGSYKSGVPWNGLTTVTERPGGAEPTNLWADNIKYASLRSSETFDATIEAYTYPDEFGVCDGTAEVMDGVKIGQQARVPFGFVYRTKRGNDTASEEDDSMIYHVIYNATASPSEKGYNTINENPDAITFSWEITTTPVSVPGYKPASTVTFDTLKLKPEALKVLEEKLFGTDDAEPTLPAPGELFELLKQAVADI